MRIQLWNLVFLIGFAVYVSIRGVFKGRTKTNEVIINRMDGVERVLFCLVFMGTFLLPLLYLFTPWLSFADYRLPALAPWLGSVVMATALWLFWRSHSDLGRNWSVTLQVRKGHELIKNGVYRFIRHPMYAAIWLFGLAQGLLLQNWLAGWSALITFAVMYFVRAPREEQMMRECFGQEYRDYVQQTGRLFPRIRS